ncbi:hypothetical protein TNCV_1084251 [Trichonephila clavipes]|nr:hypothetical protein TNCV_1084251 [Trichonephila clavipes]
MTSANGRYIVLSAKKIDVSQPVKTNEFIATKGKLILRKCSSNAWEIKEFMSQDLLYVSPCPDLAHHPQPSLNIPVLKQQIPQAWNSIPQRDIRSLYDTMHARLQASIQSSGGYGSY